MTWFNIAAREEGKWRAIGGHKADVGLNPHTNPQTGRYVCYICGRDLTWNEERHAGGRRKRKVLTPTP